MADAGKRRGTLDRILNNIVTKAFFQPAKKATDFAVGDFQKEVGKPHGFKFHKPFRDGMRPLAEMKYPEAPKGEWKLW